MPVHKYQDYSLAVRLRVTTGNMIATFANPDHLFYADQIRKMLISVFKYKDYEVSVELMEMLAFGKNKYRNLQLQELISYFLERYAGEKSIARYAKTKNYLHAQQKAMTREEFVGTVNLGLSFIQGRDIDSDASELQKLFQEISRGENTISQKEYLLFLKEYFGSQSPMVLNPTEHAIRLQSEEMLPEQCNQQAKQQHSRSIEKQLKRYEKQVGFKVAETNALQELRDLIISEIRFKCSQLDGDLDQKLTKEQTYTFFYQILLLQKHSIEYILENYFNFVEKDSVPFSEVVEVIGEVHYREIFSSLLKQESNIDNPNKIVMDNEYFNKKVVEACFFFKNKPSYALLTRVFKELVARSELQQPNVVSLQDFRGFILAFVCNRRLIFRQHSRKNTMTAANLPLSIAEVSNSNFQQDSEYNEVRPKQFQPSINECKIQQNALDQRFESEGKHSVNRISALTFINKQNQNLNPNSHNPNSHGRIRSEAIIQETEQGDWQIRENLTFVDYVGSPIEERIASKQLFESLEQDSEKQNMETEKVQPQLNLKEELWMSLSKSLQKYSTNGDILLQTQANSLIQNELAFTKRFPDFPKKIHAFFAKKAQPSVKSFLSYVIHLLAQQALMEFNKTQIQGKFVLNEAELSKLIHLAYGSFQNMGAETCFALARKLIGECNRAKFTYTNWLLIAKNKLATL